MFDGFVGRNIFFDTHFAPIETHATTSGTHIAIIGIGHFAGAIHYATHHGYFQMCQMRRGGFNFGHRFLQIEHSATAAGTRDVFGATDAPACCLQNTECQRVNLFDRNLFVAVSQQDAIAKTIDQ